MNRRNRLQFFLQERLGLDALQGLASKKRVPCHRSTSFYYLGGMALFLFLVQIVTGILLSLYYKPSPDQAFESVRAIMTEIDFGWLIRSAHSWSANLLIARVAAAPADDVHDAVVPATARTDLADGRRAIGPVHGLRL